MTVIGLHVTFLGIMACLLRENTNLLVLQRRTLRFNKFLFFSYLLQNNEQKSLHPVANLPLGLIHENGTRFSCIKKYIIIFLEL